MSRIPKTVTANQPHVIRGHTGVGTSGQGSLPLTSSLSSRDVLTLPVLPNPCPHLSRRIQQTRLSFPRPERLLKSTRLLLGLQ